MKLYRLDFWEGFGFPKCERRERRSRIYRSLADAERMVMVIEKMPEHHLLINAYEGDIEWQPTEISPAPMPSSPDSLEPWGSD